MSDKNIQGETPAWPWAALPDFRADYRRRNPPVGTADLPAALAERPQWLVWRYEPGEDESKKYRKVPHYIDGGKRAGDQGSEKDRRRLSTAADAISFLRGKDFDGLGFAFLPDDGLIGIDLDGMIDTDTGEVSERCQAIIDACDSYTELSPSGKGVHIYCSVDHGEGDERLKSFKSNKIGVECFVGAQFFTVTGRAWGDSDLEVRPIPIRTLRRLKATVEAARRPAGSEATGVPNEAPSRPGNSQRTAVQEAALAAEALACLDADDYHLWIDMGMACKAGLGSYGYAVWDEWSSRSHKYAGAAETEERWKSFIPSTLTLAALYSRATSAGWESPWAKAEKRKAAREAKRAAEDSGPAHFDYGAAAPGAPETHFDATKAPAEEIGEAPPVPGPPDPDRPAPPDDDEWERYLVKKSGVVTSCLANAELILSHMRVWQGVIGYDEFAERTMFRKSLPCDPRGPDTGEWSDHLDSMTAIWLQRTFRVEFSPKTVLQAVEVVARRNRFHPVREALTSLPPWDGVPRNSEWLSDYLGIERMTYTGLVGKFFLRGMIKRVLQPGCKFDYCLVLEGDQGLGKSTVARILAWHWFADTDLDLSSKDALMALAGHWVYEISEMGSLMRAEEKKQKSFLSRQEDEYRPPYGRRLIRVPRQSVFVGTTNEEEYLKDPTGGRRFWPVYCRGPFDLDGLRSNIEQMFAEALAEVLAGQRCWPDDEEQKLHFTPQQFKRGMEEPFIDILRKWVSDRLTNFTMAEAVTDGMGLSADKMTPAMTTRVGQALKKLGCLRQDKGSAFEADQRRPYVPPQLRTGAGAVQEDSNAGF